MDAREEALGLLNKVWQKLQALPDADPVELGAFFILLTFIGEYFSSATSYVWVLFQALSDVCPFRPTQWWCC